MLCYARLYHIGVTAASTCTLNENFDVDLGGLTLTGASPLTQDHYYYTYYHYSYNRYYYYIF